MKKLGMMGVALMATLALSSAVATAGAGDVTTVASRVTIKFNGGNGPYAEQDHFTGRVRSKKRKCRKNRKVAVYRRAEGVGVLVGRDTTNRRGRYRVSENNVPPGRYYTKAKRKRFHRGNHRFVCKRARSKTIRVNG